MIYNITYPTITNQEKKANNVKPHDNISYLQYAGQSVRRGNISLYCFWI